jgi:hypothetical protein
VLKDRLGPTGKEIPMADQMERQKSDKDEQRAGRAGTGPGVAGGTTSPGDTDTQRSHPGSRGFGSGGSTRGMSSGFNPATNDGNKSGSGSGGEGESDMEEEPNGSSQGANG